MVPHLPLLLLGLAAGAVASAAALRLPAEARAWVLPVVAAVGVTLAPGPDLGVAARSWDLATPVAVAAVALAAVGAAGAGAVTGRLGTTTAAPSLAAAAIAVVLGVPDTEGAVLLVGLLAPVALVAVLADRSSPGTWPVPPGAAGVVAAGIVLVGLAGATDGRAGAVGAWGCVAVLAGTAAARAERDGSASLVVPLVVAGAATAVARTAAEGGSSTVVLAVTAAAAAVVAVAARLTSGRELPGR